MQDNKILETGITYDDVLLVPAYSEVLPCATKLNTHLTRDISLNIPLVSAAMDTVTEYATAIAMAREGGIGVIHKNMSIEQQAEQVDRVKRSESGMIQKPITLTGDKLIKDAIAIMGKFHISGIPIVDDCGKLIGILRPKKIPIIKPIIGYIILWHLLPL